MTSGMILNTIICWAIFLIACLTAINIFHAKKEKVFNSFALFWFLAGVLWFEAGLRQLFAWQGQFALDKTVFVLDQMLVFTHYLPLVYFIFYLIFQKHSLAQVFLGLFAFMSLLALYSFKFGFTPTNITYFSTKYIAHPLTKMIFTLGFIVLLVSAIFLVIKHAYQIIIKKQKQNYPLFIALISIIIYFVFGYFDQMGFFSNWYLLMIRLMILVAAATAYCSHIYGRSVDPRKNN